MDSYRFGTVDYIVLVGMTILSTGTGLYFGGINKHIDDVELTNIAKGKSLKQNFGSDKIDEYLMGSRNMNVVPVSISLIGSFVSGVTIMGIPSEIYHYGTQYFLVIMPIILQGIAISYIYLPVYSALKVHSAYQYLEMRFNSSVRTIASFMFIFSTVSYMPFVIYVPALALNQVSGLNSHLIEVLIVLACVSYTLMGGLKAVVHTDVWQMVVMFFSVTAVAVFALLYSNGFGALFEDVEKGGRLILANTNASPYVRHTLWSVLIGGFSYWTSINVTNQAMVQRYMSLPSLKKSRDSLYLFTVGITIFVALCCFLGLLIFEKYKDCDPLSAGLIAHDDQLLPLFVVETVGHIYGMPGLFIAGIFGAGLSTLSSCFNTVALVFLEDIVRGCLKLQPSERVSTILIKSSIVFQGVMAFLLVFLIRELRGVLSVCNSIASITAGTALGIFTLGMLVPWSNTVGTATGGIISIILAAWLSFGSQIAAALGQLSSQMLPVSVEGCLGNVTTPQKHWVDQEEVFPLYRLSYHWINPIGVVTTVVVGALVSLVTKPTDIKTINSKLISPVIHRFLPRECFRDLHFNEESLKKVFK
ncbi:sodium-coupled monocarboxylate transporter 2 isoform X2 [Drosophila rhopaloa]|uniref:Sodium-coupled monocarboxylate transporter 1 n=1 Tax=Drosophila rhopaloa TaxID=1041015 RepID=A0ABM5J7W9_DRORH|nr:sodium-coupled monocarboxylate transporter 2 isoform X2 [Drosophila rhopaloa]